MNVPASYTLTVTNTGSAATTAAATVSDTIPASLTPGAAPAGCTIAGQSVTCTIASGLAVGASVSFVLPVTPTVAASGTTVSNTASVSGGGSNCPAASTCSSTVDVPVDAPELAIVKTASTPTFTVNVPASYTLTVTNTGNAPTTADATVSDPVPASLTIGSVSPGCTPAGQLVTCTIAPGLAPAASVSFTVQVTPTAAASGTTVSNTATVGGGGSSNCRGGCSATVDVPVDAPALSLVKTASTPNFTVGTPASYTLTVTNTGNAATTAVATVSDPVPASLTLGTMPAACTLAGQSVSCTIPAGLAVGASVSFVIPVTPTAAASGIVSNTATVSGGGTSCPAAASCSGTVDVPVGEAADLLLTKDDGGATSAPGGSIAWTLSVTNNGPSDATDVSVSDPYPAGLTYVSASGVGWSCSDAAGTLTCTRPSLANGATATIALVLNVPAGYAGPNPVVNTARVSSTTPDPNPNNNTGTDPTPLGTGEADLSVSKTDNGVSVAPGATVSYTLVVRNAGPSDAQAVQLEDPAPPGLTFVSASAPCTSLPCNLGTLAAGASTTVTVVFQVPLAYNGPRPISNSATASSVTPDPNPANNTGTDTTPVLVPPRPPLPAPALGPFGLAALMLLLAGLAYAESRRRPVRSRSRR